MAASPTTTNSCSSSYVSATDMHAAAMKLALLVMCAIGFADMFTYSMPAAFLGQALAADDTSSVKVVLALVRPQLG
jgi:hypothetical protein